MREILEATAREGNADVRDVDALLRVLHTWADHDVKATPLKELQGRIWAEGFESSGIRGHLYPDAVAALRRYAGAGVRLYVYSSGSIAAQKLLFGHSVAGDLLPLFTGFYDTTIGGKRAASSYERLLREIDCEAGEVLFFSDNEFELDAAREAGLQTVQLARPEDSTLASSRHASVASFDGLNLSTIGSE